MSDFLPSGMIIKSISPFYDYFDVLVVKIHGNPGDYAWGRGGLDAIITQVTSGTYL